MEELWMVGMALSKNLKWCRQVNILNCCQTFFVMEIIKPSCLRLDSLNYNPTSEIGFWFTFLAIYDETFVMLLLTVMPCRTHLWKRNWWKGRHVNCLLLLSPQMQRLKLDTSWLIIMGANEHCCELLLDVLKIKVLLSWGKKIIVVGIA